MDRIERAQATGTTRAKVRYLKLEWKGRNERAQIGTKESRRANTAAHHVSIVDGRPLWENGDLEIDVHGFCLKKFCSKVGDFRNHSEIESTYYSEVGALVAEHTGAEQVFIIGHLIRTEDTSSFNNAYARFLHCDYSQNVPRKQAMFVLAENGIDLDKGCTWEFAWFNTWQPIEREVQQNPLTLIDASSISDGDLVEYLYTATGTAYPSTMPTYNPRHRFYYFPRMQTDEIMLFRQLDTRPQLTPCPHTSFDDLRVSSGALARRSIETRMMCAFATKTSSA